MTLRSLSVLASNQRPSNKRTLGLLATVACTLGFNSPAADSCTLDEFVTWNNRAFETRRAKPSHELKHGLVNVNQNGSGPDNANRKSAKSRVNQQLLQASAESLT